MTNDELVSLLFHYTDRQVALQREGKLRLAVEARKEAREIGAIIRYRIRKGTWV